jgi:colanic acid/amylovoran biosynthesis glycosyltransferase
MEAMSVGIPAIATDVGGTSELVNEYVGMLLPASITPTELARKIALFKDLSIENRQFLSSNAITRVAELYDGRMNARSLFQKFRSSMKADKDL